MQIPVVSRFQPTISRLQLQRIEGLARLVLREFPNLRTDQDTFHQFLVDDAMGDEPVFHLDDFSEIPVIGTDDNSLVLQQRARLRAFDGDYVATSKPIEAGFVDYCERQLGLGKVNWLFAGKAHDVNSPEPGKIQQSVNNGRLLAIECWKIREVRNDLIRAIRQNGLRYIHPHVSTLHVWELARLLQSATRRPLSVIGPVPAMARWANNKIEFTRIVRRLLGDEFVPHTESAWNFATLGQAVARLSPTNSKLGIKFPYGTGGRGNFLIDTDQIRGRTLAETREFLKLLLSEHRWPRTGRVLIDVWEQDVISSPSVQVWIPPGCDYQPVIEGLFQQSVVGEKGSFAGSCVLELPTVLQQQIVDSSFLLATLFQKLGYVGRCSFDLILIGENIGNCRFEFIECNARWGGTSIPMTLMNRLGIRKAGNTWCVQNVHVSGLDQICFSQLAGQLLSETYDYKTKRGAFVLFNPARLKANSAVDAIAIAESSQSACDLLFRELPEIISRILASSTGVNSPGWRGTQPANNREFDRTSQ